jgi:hypothetical protein
MLEQFSFHRFGFLPFGFRPKDSSDARSRLREVHVDGCLALSERLPIRKVAPIILR